MAIQLFMQHFLYVSSLQQTRGAWRKVFFVAAAIYLFGTIFYAIFGSGEKQAWASSQPTNSTNKDEEKALKEKVDNNEKEVKS